MGLRGNGLCLIRCNDWEFSQGAQWVGLVVDVGCWVRIVFLRGYFLFFSVLTSVVYMGWLGLVRMILD